MASNLDKLRSALQALQEQIEDELSRRRDEFLYRLENGRVVFEAETRRRHRQLRISLREFLARTRPSVVITAPVIYSLIIPFVLLDLWVMLYQAVCFPVYGIPKARRADYIRIDRHHLAYLNGLQKLNCVYCGYCNGVVAWVREVAARTEAYWCPVKHASRVEGSHGYYAGFLDYGDAEGYLEGLANSRQALRHVDRARHQG